MGKFAKKNEKFSFIFKMQIYIMRKKIIIVFNLFISLLLFSCNASNSNPESVYEKDGNIFLKFENQEIKQITYTKTDTLPIISPDKEKIVFIRKTNGNEIDAGSGPVSNNEIWIYNIKDNNSEAIVKYNGSEDPETMLAPSLTPLYFTSDNKSIYFTCYAWATSDAIHKYDLITKSEKFVSAGNSLFLIPNGKYKDYLLIQKHKYYNNGGSYDYTWLLNGDGKEIREIGEVGDDVIQKFLSDHIEE